MSARDWRNQVERKGTELPGKTPGKPSPEAAARTWRATPVTDPQLQALIDAWPTLPAAVREAIRTLRQAAGQAATPRV